MATIIKPPAPLHHDYSIGRPYSVFLAGSIEMGVAENWQTRVEKAFDSHSVVLYNPRRDDWDSSWKQSLDDENFVGQVTWELSALEKCDKILMYFDPKTMSPISMLEFGLYARSGKMIVVCPEGFWRKGNIDVTALRYGVRRVDTLEEAIAELKFDMGILKNEWASNYTENTIRP